MITTTLVILLIDAVVELLQRLLFAIGSGLCWIVGFLTDIFEKVAGLDTITYKGSGMAEEKLLIRVFFGNSNVNTIYWGMALIGIVMCFSFTIAAVIKKSGDSEDKMKQSMGGILQNCFKSITLILLMNFILSATISLTSTLMDRINYLIVNAQSFDMNYDVTFDSEDYLYMARSLNTIGNYSLNASYNSRYNLNSCYNDIRGNLKKLADKGKFDVTYITTTFDENGKSETVHTWQSVLQAIYRSVDDIDSPQPLDEYNTKLSEALLEAMDIIKNDASFAALESYHVNQSGQQVGEMVSLDRMIMLLGSMYGSGGSLSKGSGMTDYLRGPYYYGQKDIFDYYQCNRDFDMSLGTWLYLTVIITAFFFLREMLAMVFNASARIFNMLLLYISAPPFLAVTPLDDGGKLKQWTTAFVIQSLGLFGTIISLRIVMIFIPILFGGDIQFFEGARSDIITRVIIMYAALFTARKASGMIVGILADNAGMQAISAGDVGSEGRGIVDTGVGIGKAIGGFAISAASGALGMGGKSISGFFSGGNKSKTSEGSTGSASSGTATKTSSVPASRATGTSPGSTGITQTNKSSVPASRSGAKGTEPLPGGQKTQATERTPNSKGTAASGGTYETGSSGSARDYTPPKQNQPEKTYAAQPGYHSDYESEKRPHLESESKPQIKPLPGSLKDKF